MLLQQLNNDCISEIVSHLNFKYWDHFKNTSKIFSSLINEQKYNIKMCIDDTWGNITISGKKYNHHYFGEVIKPKKIYKKAQHGYIRHGYGVYTKQTGKYTKTVYRGYFINNVLQSNYHEEYIRDSFTYRNGPFKGTFVEGIRFKKYNYTMSFLDGLKNNCTIISYSGGWKNNKPHGFGYTRELAKYSKYSTTYNPLDRNINHENGIITHYGTYVNGIKHDIFEERWLSRNPFSKYIRFVNYDMGKPINRSVYICRNFFPTQCLDTKVIIYDYEKNTKQVIVNKDEVYFTCKNINLQTFEINKLQQEIIDPFDRDTTNECDCCICSNIQEFSY